MKKFQEMIIKHSKGELIHLLDQIKLCNSSFLYREDKSEEYASAIFHNEDTVGCFSTEAAYLAPAYVWVVIVSDKLKVTNITPMMAGYLSISQYNQILNAFFQDMIKPFLNESWKDCVHITGEDVSLKSILPEKTYQNLANWECCCNKAAPISHPNDYERWMIFVVSLYKSGVDLPVYDFQKWLSEDCRWPSGFNDSIEDMGEKLEYSLDLLKCYDRD